jgi:hypothetical protein
MITFAHHEVEAFGHKELIGNRRYTARHTTSYHQQAPVWQEISNWANDAIAKNLKKQTDKGTLLNTHP